jgi:hypothetical protein
MPYLHDSCFRRNVEEAGKADGTEGSFLHLHLSLSILTSTTRARARVLEGRRNGEVVDDTFKERRTSEDRQGLMMLVPVPKSRIVCPAKGGVMDVWRPDQGEKMRWTLKRWRLGGLAFLAGTSPAIHGCAEVFSDLPH